ncbi:MAG TPA: glycosyltransferase [Gemmatimonadaceae bacterium]|nr:glycosyltransferase [Gemmatimonadaceae bacterium]
MRVVASPAYANRFLNPYQWLLHTHLERSGVEVSGTASPRLWTGECDVWHPHWPDAPLNRRSALAAATAARGLLRWIRHVRGLGVRIVWTVHNLHSHERYHPELEERFWRRFTPLLDGWTSLSAAGRDAALARHPELRERPGFVIPHGHYRGVYPDTLSRAEARQRLGLPADARAIAFLGRLRPYKNVPHLMRVFAELADPRARLVVAGGRGPATLMERVRTEARRDARVLLHPGHVPGHHLQRYLRAADLVALPFTEILNSGSAILALSFDRPVLVPARGSLAELRDVVGARWVRTYEGELTADVLRDALAWAREPSREAAAPLDALAWPAIARRTRGAYEAIVGGVGQPSDAAAVAVA